MYVTQTCMHTVNNAHNKSKIFNPSLLCPGFVSSFFRRDYYRQLERLWQLHRALGHDCNACKQVEREKHELLNSTLNKIIQNTKSIYSDSINNRQLTVILIGTVWYFLPYLRPSAVSSLSIVYLNSSLLEVEMRRLVLPKFKTKTRLKPALVLN